MADIRHAIQIAAKPEVIYPLCATANGFERWWAADVTERDGVVELGFSNAQRFIDYGSRTPIRQISSSGFAKRATNGRRADHLPSGIRGLEYNAAVLPPGMAIGNGLVHLVQHDVGRIDVSAERRGGGQIAWPSVPCRQVWLLSPAFK